MSVQSVHFLRFPLKYVYINIYKWIICHVNDTNCFFFPMTPLSLNEYILHTQWNVYNNGWVLREWSFNIGVGVGILGVEIWFRLRKGGVNIV